MSDPLVIVVLDPAPPTNPPASLTLLAGVGDLNLKSFDDGVTVRTSLTGAGFPVSFRYSSSESKENPGMITDRKAVRLDVRKDAVGENGLSSVAQATLTLSHPRVGFSLVEIHQLVFALFGTLLADQAGFVPVERYLAGDPIA